MSKALPGRLFVLSAPSGSGKTTILEAILSTEKNIVRSVSVTTRLARQGERHGRDYLFVTPSRFDRMRRGRAFLECAKVVDHWYGTPWTPIKRAIRKGTDALLVIDVEGARQIRKKKLPSTTVFLLPPSRQALRQRLLKRGTEDPKEIGARLSRTQRELAQLVHYDYAVINDRLREAIRDIRTILRAERLRVRGDKTKCRLLLRNCWKG